MSDDNKALDLAELRRVAEAATEGPWRFEPEGDSECGEDACCSDYWENRIWGGGVVIAESHLLSDDDADHIATFGPPTALALLDRLEAAEHALGRLREINLRNAASAGAEALRADRAEAKVARVEALLRCPFIHAGENAVWVAAIDAALRGDA